jgi:methionine synthase / methylenetetrahydrofolate reductase(NADPH)
MHPFLQKLSERPLLCDGAMGTMLFSMGASDEQCLEYLTITRPGWITEIHQAFAAAGADVIKTHTFGSNRVRLADVGLQDRVRDLNFRAVKLVRDVREVVGRSIFIAGDVGPLGKRLAPYGPVTVEEAAAAFQEQIAVLWEAGADLILFETFSEIAELEIAVRAAKAVCDLPIVASMTYNQDGRTGAGVSPGEAVQRLSAAGADVAGINCSVGPAPSLEVLSEMHRADPAGAFSIMPNAGFPARIDGRFSYPAGPGYFARHVAPFLDNGARLIGGCCGTTPMHIREMRTALDAYLAQKGVATLPAVLADELPYMHIGLDMALDDDTDDPHRDATDLLRKIRAGKFVISVEVDPPRGFNAQKQIEGARHAKSMGADASPMARVRMSALSLCVQIQQQVGIESIVHFTTRDRSLMGLQADLIGAQALGVRNILALTGDPPSLGESRNSTPVYDVDSIGLVRIINRFNEGFDQGDNKMGQPGNFTIAVACDPTRADLAEEADRFHQKVSGGAHFTMTQPIYDPQVWLDFLHVYEERHGAFPVPVLIGILPLQSHRHASFLHNEVPGITLTETALERMRKAGADGRQEGVAMAQELLLQLVDAPHVQGVYLMPSFGRYEVACQVLEALTPAQRGIR